MNLLQPTSFASVVASSKEQLKNISAIILKHCGQEKANAFLVACKNIDFKTANAILDETITELTGSDSVSIGLGSFADKFPQLSPDLGSKVSSALSETDKVKAINSYESMIINIIDGK